MLQLLLDNPHLCGDVDVVDMDSNTPLHFAMAAGDHQVCGCGFVGARARVCVMECDT